MKTRNMTQLLRALRKFAQDANLQCIQDKRAARGKRYNCCELVKTFLIGMVSGLMTVTQLERFCPKITAAVSRVLQIPRQISDTTLRNFLLLLNLESLREALRNSAHVGRQRKAVKEDAFDWPAVACDGKTTRSFYQQQQVTQWHSRTQQAYLTTITCTAISSRLRPCLDFLLKKPDQNERGCFAEVFASLRRHFARWMQIVTYDAGACSRANAQIVHEAHRGYLFGLKGNEPTLYEEAKQLLGQHVPTPSTAAETELSGGKVITRRIWTLSFPQETLLPKQQWPHTCTLVRVHKQTYDKRSGRIEKQDRYYVSNIPICAHKTHPCPGHTHVLQEGLSNQQFLQLVRLHWGVETDHCLWDRFLGEDKHKWVLHPLGMLNVQALHRIVSNFLVLYQYATRRSAEKDWLSWPELMESFMYMTYCLTRLPTGAVWWDTS